jgi:hypothetical protein
MTLAVVSSRRRSGPLRARGIGPGSVEVCSHERHRKGTLKVHGANGALIGEADPIRLGVAFLLAHLFR